MINKKEEEMEVFSCNGKKWYVGDVEINGYKSIVQNNNLIYQGEFLGGKYHGYGILYNLENNILYQGEFSNAVSLTPFESS